VKEIETKKKKGGGGGRKRKVYKIIAL